VKLHVVTRCGNVDVVSIDTYYGNVAAMICTLSMPVQKRNCDCAVKMVTCGAVICQLLVFADRHVVIHVY